MSKIFREMPKKSLEIILRIQNNPWKCKKKSLELKTKIPGNVQKFQGNAKKSPWKCQKNPWKC